MKNNYPISQRNIPLDDSWDVIVIGGGPAELCGGRIMTCCITMGEAAGLAAALVAADPHHGMHAVNTDALRDRMRQYGAYLP